MAAGPQPSGALMSYFLSQTSYSASLQRKGLVGCENAGHFSESPLQYPSHLLRAATYIHTAACTGLLSSWCGSHVGKGIKITEVALVLRGVLNSQGS